MSQNLKSSIKYVYKYIFFPCLYIIAKLLAKFPFIKDSLLQETIASPSREKEAFQVLDFGSLSRYRAKTLLTKEPETISWIQSFAPEDILFDIGANIGIYSLYAAMQKIKVVSFEPNALNYSLLNMNIFCNQFQDRITAYPVALHDKVCFSELNMQSFQWGGALSSFSRNRDYRFSEYTPSFQQGAIGITLDYFIESISLVPTHIKIDVDGNEGSVLKGASKTLTNPLVQSILVELLPFHPEYTETISLIKRSGFELVFPLPTQELINEKNPINHIFRRR